MDGLGGFMKIGREFSLHGQTPVLKPGLRQFGRAVFAGMKVALSWSTILFIMKQSWGNAKCSLGGVGGTCHAVGEGG
jgi:hypothetical protein